MGASAGKEGFHQCKNLVSTCTGEVSVRETAGKSYKYRTNEDATDWENKMDEFVQKMENVTMQRETDDDFPEDDTMLGAGGACPGAQQDPAERGVAVPAHEHEGHRRWVRPRVAGGGNCRRLRLPGSNYQLLSRAAQQQAEQRRLVHRARVQSVRGL